MRLFLFCLLIGFVQCDLPYASLAAPVTNTEVPAVRGLAESRSLIVAPTTAPAPAEPEYAKWSRLAVQDAVSKGYELLDYKYFGKRVISRTAAEHRFKFRVRKGGELLGLLVSVRYKPFGDQLIRIRYRKTAH